MSAAPTMVPGALSRPPITRIGNTLSPTMSTLGPPPALNVHRTPVTTDRAPAIAHVIARWPGTSIPTASATCWSSAMARMASPDRVNRKNAPTPAMHRSEPGAQPRQFPQREVDRAGRLVHHDEGEREESVDGAREQTVHEQGREEPHAVRRRGRARSPSART